MTLNDAQLDRYARHIVLREIGGAGQARLLAAHVAVDGAGGIGAPVVQYLAAAGVGRITLIDDDRVDASNLQRQVLFGTGDIGRPKVAASSEAIARLTPDVVVSPVCERIDAGNAAVLLAGAEVVVDGTDNFATRLAVADAALALRMPLISAAVGQFEGQIGVFRGWEPGLPCYHCWVGNTPEREGTTCAETGVLGALTGVIGSLAAIEAIRTLVPFGDDPVGKIMLCDLLTWRFRTMTLPPDPGCPACGGK